MGSLTQGALPYVIAKLSGDKQWPLIAQVDQSYLAIKGFKFHGQKEPNLSLLEFSFSWGVAHRFGGFDTAY